MNTNSTIFFIISPPLVVSISEDVVVFFLEILVRDQEILFNPYTHDQVSQIRSELKELLEIIDKKDADGMKGYLTKIRNNVRKDIEIKK